jgi:hypothetical protein
MFGTADASGDLLLAGDQSGLFGAAWRANGLPEGQERKPTPIDVTSYGVLFPCPLCRPCHIEPQFGGICRYGVPLKWGAKTVSKFRDDPEFWRFQADEVRIKSQLLNHPGSRRAALEIASQYDIIARSVEERMQDLQKRAPAPSALHRHAITRKRDLPRLFTRRPL